MDAVAERLSEFLSDDELRELTSYKPSRRQAEWLSEHGIPHRVEGRRVIVSRVHVRGWLEGKTVTVSSGINWGAIR